MTVGEKIYSLRNGKGLSQDELAEILNVSRQTISNWENDKVTIDVDKAAELCIYFKISPNELLREKVNLPSQKDPSISEKSRKFLLMLMLTLCVCSFVCFIAFIVLACVVTDTVTSTVTSTGPIVWIALAVIFLVACIASLCLAIKLLKKSSK